MRQTHGPAEKLFVDFAGDTAAFVHDRMGKETCLCDESCGG
jgi:hypothetical protein